MVAGAAAAGSFSRYREPERLVGLGFRAWLAGYQTGDISCWEEAWVALFRNPWTGAGSTGG